jgi:hypothetical protein
MGPGPFECVPQGLTHTLPSIAQSSAFALPPNPHVRNRFLRDPLTMFNAISVSKGEAARERMVIASHHPDRLRLPVPRPGNVADARFQQMLAWNVFRTLELLPPAFWLRRLHARLGGNHFPAAPQIVRVHLWKPLPTPPAQRIDGGVSDVVVDVTIETEHAVWTLMVSGPGDHRLLESNPDDGDAIARVTDAGAWRAGLREHYFAVVEPKTTPASVGTLVRRRYSRSLNSAELRSGWRWTKGRLAGVPGILEWADLTAVLRDCEEATVFSAIERALAHNALAWLAECDLEALAAGGEAS